MKTLICTLVLSIATIATITIQAGYTKNFNCEVALSATAVEVKCPSTPGKPPVRSRKAVVVTNPTTNAETAFCGASNVTTTNAGDGLKNGASTYREGPVFCVVASGTPSVDVEEVY